MYVLLLLLQLANGSSFDQLWKQGRSELEQARYATAIQTLLAAAREGERSQVPIALRGSVINDLAMAQRHLGAYAKAESLYNESISLLRNDPQSRRQLAMALSNKATMYRDIGRYEQSTRAFEESFAIAKTLAKDDPALVVILMGMAAERSMNGDLKKAEHYLKEALRIREREVGPDQLDISEVLNNLGVVQLQRKEYADAESSLKRALVIMETHGGIGHPDVAVVLNNLGKLYYQRKQYDIAESVLTGALSIRRKTLPAENLSTADNLLSLSQVLISSNRYAEAQTLLEEAVSIRNRARGDANPEGLLTLEAYALTLRANGYTNEANAVQARAKSMRAELKFVLRY